MPRYIDSVLKTECQRVYSSPAISWEIPVKQWDNANKTRWVRRKVFKHKIAVAEISTERCANFFFPLFFNEVYTKLSLLDITISSAPTQQSALICCYVLFRLRAFMD